MAHSRAHTSAKTQHSSFHFILFGSALECTPATFIFIKVQVLLPEEYEKMCENTLSRNVRESEKKRSVLSGSRPEVNGIYSGTKPSRFCGKVQ